MVKELIIDFFEAIERNELKKNKNAKATFWVNNLQEVGYNDKHYIGVKKATRLYEKYVEKKKNVSVREPDKYLCDFMSRYLSFENYNDYLESKSRKKLVSNNTVFNINSRKFFITTSSFLFCALSVLYVVKKMVKLYDNNSNSHVWRYRYFINPPYATPKTTDNKIYLIDLETFNKITISEASLFFVSDQSKNIWYKKNTNGSFDVFSSDEILPENKTKLQPINNAILINQSILEN